MERHLKKMIKELLKEAGLDPDSSNFIHDPAYAPFKHTYMLVTDLGYTTVDYYIWKKWLSEEQRNKHKRSIFDMGVTEKPQILTHSMLYKEIANEELADDEVVRQKIVGEKSSIKSKLKEALDFNLDRFGPEQDYEKLKLLNLLYWYEKSPKNPEKVNILSVLSVPSMVNQDQRLEGRETPYGRILTELKFEVRKEVDDSFAIEVAANTSNIIKSWDYGHFNVIHLVNRDISTLDIRSELENILKHLREVIDMVSVNESTTEYESNLMDAFYLKVHQLDKTTRLEDMRKAILHICHSSHTQKLLIGNGTKPLPYEDGLIEDLKGYAEVNLERITQLAFGRKEITKSELIFIKRKLERVETLLTIFNKQRASVYSHSLTMTFLIASLQEIILSECSDEGDSETSYVYKYYKSKQTVRTLSSALKNFDVERNVEEEIYEVLWVTKIERRMYALKGRLDLYLLSVQIGEQINQIIKKITRVPHLATMYALHNYFTDQLMLTEKKTIGQYQNEFTTAVKEKTNFDCVIRTRRIFSLFDDEDVCKGFTCLMICAINGLLDLTKWNRDGELYQTVIYDHLIEIEINRQQRHFILHKSRKFANGNEIKELQNNGLSKMVTNKL
ncbi:hypothetical protein IAQ67_14865 [Paenibacillus peoriae]|uniref:Uncharacterized protein n=2 Tax=Paenibacillus peoriae TaxID=59893 RepID=A0A7H0Y288_9BACL|nr:hypothetical protein IAQ67_14865 [Paenibacillus peoriae]